MLFSCGSYVGFQPGFPGTLGFRQHAPGVPPELIQMRRLGVIECPDFKSAVIFPISRTVFVL